MTTLKGFLHARAAYAALAFLLILSALAVAFPMITSGVSIRPNLPPRGVGISEYAAVIAASCIPILTRPRFNGAEKMASWSRKAAHTAFTGVVILSPSLPAIAWYLRILGTKAGYQLPNWTQVLGIPIFLGSLAVLALLLLGSAAALITPPLVFAGIVITQHLYPEGLTARLFAVPSPTNWQNYWPPILFCFVLALVLAYRRGSVAKS